MKFINYLERITGVGIFPLISLLIFFLFFTALLVWVFKVDKRHIKMMAYMPFADEKQTIN
jgi:cbb3-type cytochrome oxidase subunit 3